jgi:predicted dehydrogenase
MATDPVRIGVIGIGFYAQVAHVPAFQATGRAEIVAIARRNPEALAAAQQALGGVTAYTDWRSMLEREDLDAVVVSTPDHLHTEPTLVALERGLHVLLDKPMALTRRDAQAMVAAAAGARQVLMVAYNARFQSCWRAAKRALETGAIGCVRQVDLAESSDFRWLWQLEHLPEWCGGEATERGIFGIDNLAAFWRRNPAVMGGGMFVNHGTHQVDLGLWLGGAPATQVVAFREWAGLPTEFFVTSQARLANGVLLALTAGFGVALDEPESRQAWPPGLTRLTILGDRGALTAESQGEAIPLWLERAGRREQLEVAEADTTPAAAFIAAIRDGAENPCPGTEAAHAVAFMEAAHRSMREGQIVAVEQADQAAPCGA